MKLLSPAPGRRGPSRGWLVVLPSLIIVALVFILTESSNAAPPAAQPARVLSDQLSQTQEPPLCQSCHPQEYEVWKNSMHAKAALDPVFQEQLSKSHNQTSCLACHTTGFDTGSGKFMSQGVTCEACHGAYKEGHPKAETMELPMASDACRMCHQAAFNQWETSQHAENKIDCYDCHQAHTQGLRIEPEAKLCNACHSDQDTALAHSVHGITGVDCKSCHMATQLDETGSASGMQLEMSNHNFTVASDVCVRCHSDAAHSAAATGQVPTNEVQAEELKQLETRSERITELEQQIGEMQRQTGRLQNVAVVSMGLMLGVGGVLGLIVGVGGMALLTRRKN